MLCVTVCQTVVVSGACQTVVVSGESRFAFFVHFGVGFVLVYELVFVEYLVEVQLVYCVETVSVTVVVC